MNRRRLILLLVLAAAAGAGWLRFAAVRRAAHAPSAAAAFVPIVDGKTLDFSTGRGVTTDTPADRAALADGLTAISEASQDVSFSAPAPPPPVPPAPGAPPAK